MAFVFMLSACASDNYAPVTDIATIQPIPHSGTKQIAKGESLYTIAWQYGLDYRDLARRNHLQSPYHMHTGEQIYLKGHAPRHHPSRVAAAVPSKPVVHQAIKKTPVRKVDFSPHWAWPAKGHVIEGFAGLNKGINISGSYGEPVYAVNGGKVVYSGNGLRAYGNLIIIKHNDEYMSAYAHNSVVLVHEGDIVKKRDKIAEMGNSGTNKIMLHFEIRRNGYPVNPINILKS